jgi:hypothetical protein
MVLPKMRLQPSRMGLDVNDSVARSRENTHRHREVGIMMVKLRRRGDHQRRVLRKTERRRRATAALTQMGQDKMLELLFTQLRGNASSQLAIRHIECRSDGSLLSSLFAACSTLNVDRPAPAPVCSKSQIQRSKSFMAGVAEALEVTCLSGALREVLSHQLPSIPPSPLRTRRVIVRASGLARVYHRWKLRP